MISTSKKWLNQRDPSKYRNRLKKYRSNIIPSQADEKVLAGAFFLPSRAPTNHSVGLPHRGTCP